MQVLVSLVSLKTKTDVSVLRSDGHMLPFILTRTALPDLSETNYDNLTPGSSPSTVSSNQSQIAYSFGVHFAGRELGKLSFLTGVPFLLPEGQAWIQARTGQAIAHDKLSPMHPPWEKERAQSNKRLLMSLTNEDLLGLPDWRTVRLYLDAFTTTSAMRRIFPVIDPDLFEETISIAYQQSTSNSRQLSSRACVTAFLAFVCRLAPINRITQNSPVDHELLAYKTQFLIAHILQEPATLDALQAITMLVRLSSDCPVNAGAYLERG